MIDYGMLSRGGISGLWLYEHDMGGTSWTLLLRLDRSTAAYLHDHGVLCMEDEPMADSMKAGVVIGSASVEARLCLSRPETCVARSMRTGLDLSDQPTPIALHRLWSSRRP